MKKALFVPLALSLAFSGISVAAEEAKNEEPSSVYMDDFSVDTIDGSTFTLSEALKDHDLVLINLWATWCGPCQYEFPFLQEAWEKNSDKIAVIALSVEPKDTEEVLKDYASENGLTFPMAPIGDTGLASFASQGTPTSIVVGSDGKVIAVEVGAITSAEDFENLFEGYTGDNYHPEECTYTVFAVDSEQNPVADVTVGLCTDTACRYVTTDEEGMAVYKGAPAKYHVQIIDAPDGYSDAMKEELYSGPYDQTLFVTLSKD